MAEPMVHWRWKASLSVGSKVVTTVDYWLKVFHMAGYWCFRWQDGQCWENRRSTRRLCRRRRGDDGADVGCLEGAPEGSLLGVSDGKLERVGKLDGAHDGCTDGAAD